MGHVKEPKGIDFVIASDPLTKKARLEITEFIRSYKGKAAGKKMKPVPPFKKACFSSKLANH